MPKLTGLQLLLAVQYTLNEVPRHRLKSCPGGFRDTYELAVAVDKAIVRAKENKEEGDV